MLTHSRIVARSKYGGQLVRYRGVGYASIFSWLRGQCPNNSLLQPPWYLTSGILLYIWARVWSTADGTFEILLRFLRRQN